jgi:glycine oxidase
MPHPDVCIAGAGIIGLSLALELHQRGLRVTVFDQGAPLTEASTAAAGMLAAADPDNPPQLRPLADLSLSLYPSFLERLHQLSHLRVPFQTHTTLQSLPPHVPSQPNELTASDLSHLLPALIPAHHRFLLLDEHSLDPRQLAPALLAAVRATTIDLRLNTKVLSIHRADLHQTKFQQTNTPQTDVEVQTSSGKLHAAHFIDCTGAWSNSLSPLNHLHVTPKKGQMLSITLPVGLPLHFVVRTPDIYIVPRTTGPSVGRAIIGATVEDAGFDKTLHPADIDHLRTLASTLIPPLAHTAQADAWAGLRPATSDGLPILGAYTGHPNHLIATGHYRNGILLAPATAHVMAQLIAGETPSVDLAPFSPQRT